MTLGPTVSQCCRLAFRKTSIFGPVRWKCEVASNRHHHVVPSAHRWHSVAQEDIKAGTSDDANSLHPHIVPTMSDGFIRLIDFLKDALADPVTPANTASITRHWKYIAENIACVHRFSPERLKAVWAPVLRAGVVQDLVAMIPQTYRHDPHVSCFLLWKLYRSESYCFTLLSVRMMPVHGHSTRCAWPRISPGAIALYRLPSLILSPLAPSSTMKPSST